MLDGFLADVRGNKPPNRPPTSSFSVPGTHHPTMIDGRRKALLGKVLLLAMANASGGLVIGGASLPLAMAATSSASSGGGTADSSACVAVADRCAADPFCTGCTTAIVGVRKTRRRLQQQQQQDNDEEMEVGSAELCSSRYPSLVSGSDVSFCERVGAASCCEFSDNDTAAACMEDPLSAEFW